MLRLTDKETIEFLEKISIIPNENETLDMIIDDYVELVERTTEV